VQRYIKLLKADGWIVDVKIWPYRGALQLVFPMRVKRDIEDDNKTAGEAKTLSSDYDIDVAASYIYRLYFKTRKFSWVMTQKLSQTLSRNFVHSCGMVSRLNARMASANCF
jgi:hypothetical protein